MFLLHVCRVCLMIDLNLKVIKLFSCDNVMVLTFSLVSLADLNNCICITWMYRWNQHLGHIHVVQMYKHISYWLVCLSWHMMYTYKKCRFLNSFCFFVSCEKHNCLCSVWPLSTQWVTRIIKNVVFYTLHVHTCHCTTENDK